MGREDDLTGIADSAAEGTVGATQLEARPISRPGESAEVFNLLSCKDSEIDYFYESHLLGEPAVGVADRHFYPVDPISFRVALMARF